MPNNHPVINLEMAALARWCNGDPDGFLEICASDVTYFDPFLATRLDGLDRLRTYYDAVRGQLLATRYAMIEPRVQDIGDAAILTFRFVSSNGGEGAETRWNCTEVYRRQDESWRIVQTHWSFTGEQPTPP
jgi:hypothetical protein